MHGGGVITIEMSMTGSGDNESIRKEVIREGGGGQGKPYMANYKEERNTVREAG